jgi:hypothetical protein
MAMKHALAAVLLIGLFAIPAPQAASLAADVDLAAPMSLVASDIAPLSVAAVWSCTPRKTCSKIRSCDEAYWYYFNCSWGDRLDGDDDGVPCESICR